MSNVIQFRPKVPPTEWPIGRWLAWDGFMYADECRAFWDFLRADPYKHFMLMKERYKDG